MAKNYASVFRPGLFDDQVVIVTGGGSGIGRCTAHELASLGAKVALIGRTLEKLEAVREEIAAAGGEADCWVCQISARTRLRRRSRPCWRAFRVRWPCQQCGRPICGTARPDDARVGRSRPQNLTGGFLMAREAYTQWIAGRWRRDRQILSPICGWGRPGWGIPGAARAGMVNFTKTAAFEWSASNVRVNAVAPDRSPPPASITIHWTVREKIRNLRVPCSGRTPGHRERGRRGRRFSVERSSGLHLRGDLRVDGAAPSAPRRRTPTAPQGADACLQWLSSGVDTQGFAGLSIAGDTELGKSLDAHEPAAPKKRLSQYALVRSRQPLQGATPYLDNLFAVFCSTNLIRRFILLMQTEGVLVGCDASGPLARFGQMAEARSSSQSPNMWRSERNG